MAASQEACRTCWILSMGGVSGLGGGRALDEYFPVAASLWRWGYKSKVPRRRDFEAIMLWLLERPLALRSVALSLL